MTAKRASLQLFVLTLTFSGALEAQQQPASKPLLVPTEPKGSVELKPHPTVIQQRPVVVDLSQLKNRRLLLPLFKNAEVVLVRDEKESGPSDVSVWEGEVEGQPGSMAILATAKNVLVGDVMTRDPKGAFGFYQIRYLGNGVHVLREVDQSKFPAEEARALGGRRPSRSGPRGPRSESVAFLRAARSNRVTGRGESLAPAARDLSSASTGEPTLPAPAPDCEDPASRIDALVVYTDAARNGVHSRDAMRALIKAAVRSTNRSYGKSEVTQRLRLVHVQRVNYKESGSSLTDRDWLQKSSDVRKLRKAHAADVVVLIVNPRDDCGWSYTMEKNEHDFELWGYAVVPHDCAAGPMWSFAHELGHIMGARHNREDDKTEGKPFDFNHGLVVPSPKAGSPWHTIMAKKLEGCGEDPPGACTTRIPRWSNPDVSYPGASGDPTGTADTDNHQALEDTAPTVANFRCAPR
jgi:hypothetical protein